MRRVATILAVAGLLAVGGCATPPANYDFDPVAVIDADFDAVWSAAVEYFAVSGLPIDTIEKDSGLIVSSWMDASEPNSYNEDTRFCDCGGEGIATILWSRGKFNVFAKSATGGGTELRVTCTYQQRRELMEEFTTVNCASTGYLEKMVHDFVEATVEGSSVPRVPTLTPGESS